MGVADTEGGDNDREAVADNRWEDSSWKTYVSSRGLSPEQAGREREFRLVLIGDSPVEGIGNTRHEDALGGQTARAFGKSLHGTDFDRVRYWSYGKSGLTARGIEEEMVPYLRRVVYDIVRCQQSSTDNRRSFDDGKTHEEPSEPVMHAVILLCGVNNVLDPRSTPESYRLEVRSLLTSIRNIRELAGVPLIVLGLPDFATLPFLPWPLGLALGWRGRKMQSTLESAVNEIRQLEKCEESSYIVNRTIMVNIPEVGKIIGSIGYHRHDGEYDCDANSHTANDSQTNAGIECTMKMKWCHPLIDHIGKNAIDQSKLGSLTMKDFLCDDGFHPGKFGTVYIGSLIAASFMESVTLSEKSIMAASK